MGPPWNSRFQTNSHGHVSSDEYPVVKPIGEFRIAVVGDSFTANVTNNVRWTSLLQDDLNNGDWRSRIGGMFTRVINFGVDGTGMVQFAAKVQHEVLGFKPDLIIINFISDDIFRRLRFAAGFNPVQDRAQFIDKYVDEILSKLAWYRWYPEVVAITIGKRWNMRSLLPTEAALALARVQEDRFENRSEAVQASAAAVLDILTMPVRTLFVQQPMRKELEGRPDLELIGLVDDLQRAVPQLKTYAMQDRILAHISSRPTARVGPDDWGVTNEAMRNGRIRALFFYPFDDHYNDFGTTIYANEVAKFLIEEFPFEGLSRMR